MPSAHTFSIAQAEFGFRGEEVQLAATDVTSSVTDDGVARVLAGFEGLLFTRKP